MSSVGIRVLIRGEERRRNIEYEVYIELIINKEKESFEPLCWNERTGHIQEVPN